MKGVEGVKKFFLGSLLTGNELDIVNEQTVDIPEFLSEFRHFIVADRVDQFIHEDFSRDVYDVQLRKKFQRFQPDGIQKVCLSQADAAVDEKRVVILGRLFGDRDGGSMGKLVGSAHDKTIKAVVCVQRGVGTRAGRSFGCALF